jgi:hypothetical protein
MCPLTRASICAAFFSVRVRFGPRGYGRLACHTSGTLIGGVEFFIALLAMFAARATIGVKLVRGTERRVSFVPRKIGSAAAFLAFGRGHNPTPFVGRAALRRYSSFARLAGGVATVSLRLAFALARPRPRALPFARDVLRGLTLFLACTLFQLQRPLGLGLSRAAACAISSSAWRAFAALCSPTRASRASAAARGSAWRAADCGSSAGAFKRALASCARRAFTAMR